MEIDKIIKLQDPAIVKPVILNYLCNLVKPKVIVEIGTQRHGKDSTEDGQSTVVFERFGAEVHSVDSSLKAIEKAMSACQGRVQFHHEDGAKFLAKFVKPIDFLYLDGGDNPDETLAQFEAARLSEKGMVVIDDCMDYNGNVYGKGTKVIEKGVKHTLTAHFGRYRMAIIQND
jgi:predicted O-methyltransferase YrrM